MRASPFQMRRLERPASVLLSDAGRFVLGWPAGSPRHSKSDVLLLCEARRSMEAGALSFARTAQRAYSVADALRGKESIVAARKRQIWSRYHV